MQSPVQYQELSDALSRIGYHEDAAEYHGTLCGALSVKQPEELDLFRLLDVGDGTELRNDLQARESLARLCEQSLNALQDSEMSFTPLLPEDGETLAVRVRALSSWCAGFLYGLASKKGLDLKKCSEDAREILRDFSQFTQASDAGEEGELEENAYAELVEYIRVGAQLVFMELRKPPTADPTKSKTVH